MRVAVMGSGRARGLKQEQIVLGVTALLVVVFSITVSGFLTTDNLLALVRNVSTLGILGTAMAIVVIGGGMDLSLVATMGVATAVSIQLMGNADTPTAVAKSLVQEPELVIFDEPTRGVDVGAIEEIHQMIRSLADEGKAVIVISSYLPEILALSDRILVARQGRIVAEFAPEDATEEKIMYAAVH
jgi:ABC-type transporter Mla maintaining outer membrane lipid asymmetry ATPase subunit MlaF